MSPNAIDGRDDGTLTDSNVRRQAPLSRAKLGLRQIHGDVGFAPHAFPTMNGLRIALVIQNGPGEETSHRAK
jgi:hypothetical protein